MDTTRRTLVKAITWQVSGIVTMVAISYPHTQSWLSALTLATSASVTGFFFFLIHEKVWNAIRWGRQT